MNLFELNHKIILYACLDWGYGHVTRSIAIIQELLTQKNKVIIACNKEQESLFKSYFPTLTYEFLEGYNFHFKGKGNWIWDLCCQLKPLFQIIKKEHQHLKNITKAHKCEVVVSDHRYGFYSKEILSIFVTHQLHLPLSKAFFFIQKWHEKQLKKFSTVWVLDNEKSTLAGKLSKKISHSSIHYIGWKSRFNTNLSDYEKKYDYLIVISGPKPYSHQLLGELKQKLDFKNKKIAVLHRHSLEFSQKTSNLDYFLADDLKKTDLLFFQSEIIISRSGYSTIMDLKILKKKGILVPTKGQYEQEYLKHFLRKDTQFVFLD